jgi:kumamolisin
VRGGAFAGEKARGRRVFPILGNRHPRPFGEKYHRTGAPLRDLKQELTVPEDSEPLVQLAGTTGAGQTIAVIELGGGFSSSDLDTYFGGSEPQL